MTDFISDSSDTSQGWSADYDTGRGPKQPLYNSPTTPAVAGDQNHYEYEYSSVSEESSSVFTAFVNQDSMPLAPAAHVRNPLFINERLVRLAPADTNATAVFSQYGKVPSNYTNIAQEIDKGAKEVVMEIGDILQKETPM